MVRDREIRSEIDRIAPDRASHAMAAATTATELGAPDGDDLDTRFAQKGIRRGVSVVGDHHAGLDGHDIVSVIPLLALL